MVPIRLTLPIIWMIRDLVSCGGERFLSASIPVSLGASVTLNCTYNCSPGFVRGCWRKTSHSFNCLGTSTQGTECVVTLHLENLTTTDLSHTYVCFTQHTDEPTLTEKIQRNVTLRLQAETTAPAQTVTHTTRPENSSPPVDTKEPAAVELREMKTVAAVTVTVAAALMGLAVALCIMQRRRGYNGESSRTSTTSPHGVCSPAWGSTPIRGKRAAVQIATPDNQSDGEVSYADIVITVRGVSTPELTQICYLSPGEQKQPWLADSRSLLQASRSADRLNVAQPREVGRRVSTCSEYAIITYS